MIQYNQQVNVKLKKEQLKSLQEQANKYSLPVSSFIRMELFKNEKKV